MVFSSGLDSVSSAQVVSHLRNLALGGRTVVCVIHQPSSRIFDMFDDLYVVANGRIIYGGPVSDMVTVFQTAGFKCPQYYNRADFGKILVAHRSSKFWFFVSSKFCFYIFFTLAAHLEESNFLRK